ncbi:hypothetical protein LXL04_023945 [Taraxacum kok-saghyz]
MFCGLEKKADPTCRGVNETDQLVKNSRPTRKILELDSTLVEPSSSSSYSIEPSRARETQIFHELELGLEIEARGELELSFDLERGVTVRVVAVEGIRGRCCGWADGGDGFQWRKVGVLLELSIEFFVTCEEEGAPSMSSIGLKMENVPPDLHDVDREPFFSFKGLVKSEAAIHGNDFPILELVDNSPFKSTLYTDSINRVSKLIRKFEFPISNSPVTLNDSNPELNNVNSDKSMDVDVDVNAGIDSNMTDRDIYGSILDINSNLSISAFVEEFDKEVNLFCEWGDNNQMKNYWNSLSTNEKENLLLVLQIKMIAGTDYATSVEKVVMNMKTRIHMCMS